MKAGILKLEVKINGNRVIELVKELATLASHRYEWCLSIQKKPMYYNCDERQDNALDICEKLAAEFAVLPRGDFLETPIWKPLNQENLPDEGRLLLVLIDKNINNIARFGYMDSPNNLVLVGDRGAYETVDTEKTHVCWMYSPAHETLPDVDSCSKQNLPPPNLKGSYNENPE